MPLPKYMSIGLPLAASMSSDSTSVFYEELPRPAKHKSSTRTRQAKQRNFGPVDADDLTRRLRVVLDRQEKPLQQQQQQQHLYHQPQGQHHVQHAPCNQVTGNVVPRKVMIAAEMSAARSGVHRVSRQQNSHQQASSTIPAAPPSAVHDTSQSSALLPPTAVVKSQQQQHPPHKAHHHHHIRLSHAASGIPPTRRRNLRPTNNTITPASAASEASPALASVPYVPSQAATQFAWTTSTAVPVRRSPAFSAQQQQQQQQQRLPLQKQHSIRHTSVSPSRVGAIRRPVHGLDAHISIAGEEGEKEDGEENEKSNEYDNDGCARSNPGATALAAAAAAVAAAEHAPVDWTQGDNEPTSSAIGRERWPVVLARQKSRRGLGGGEGPTAEAVEVRMATEGSGGGAARALRQVKSLWRLKARLGGEGPGSESSVAASASTVLSPLSPPSSTPLSPMAAAKTVPDLSTTVSPPS